jgi:hypothetical protein
MTTALLMFLGLQVQSTTICPPKVVTNQQLAAPLADWTVRPDGFPNQLAGITFFEGPPEQQASLAPDRETKTQSTWYFSKPSWIACHYSGTSLMLTRTLPKGTRSCAVTFQPDVTVAGLPAIQKIECK